MHIARQLSASDSRLGRSEAEGGGKTVSYAGTSLRRCRPFRDRGHTHRGSLNFKTKYAPTFPLVEITRAKPGSMTTVATLNEAGLIAPESPLAPASVPRANAPARPATGRHWPNYQQALRGAPIKGDGTPDRSRADFMFCKWAAERGWSVEEVAEKLAEVSAKAQERIQVKGDQGYTLLTARNGAAAVERERNRRPFLKGTARP
jgi:hypothetical protein